MQHVCKFELTYNKNNHVSTATKNIVLIEWCDSEYSMFMDATIHFWINASLLFFVVITPLRKIQKRPWNRGSLQLQVNLETSCYDPPNHLGFIKMKLGLSVCQTSYEQLHYLKMYLKLFQKHELKKNCLSCSNQ